MNLLNYAVSQKLAGKGLLLEHVVAKKDLQLNLVAESFESLMRNYQDFEAEALVSDYKKFLQDRVQLNLITKDANTFEVSGDIDDDAFEAIALVHNIDKESLVKELVLLTVHNLVGDRDVSISDILFSESEVHITPKVDTGLFDVAVAADEGIVYSDVDEVDIDSYLPGDSDEFDYEFEEPELIFEDVDGEIIEPVNEPVVEKFDSKTKTSIKEIYNEFINDLKNKGLDQRLGLSLEAA